MTQVRRSLDPPVGLLALPGMSKLQDAMPSSRGQRGETPLLPLETVAVTGSRERRDQAKCDLERCDW